MKRGKSKTSPDRKRRSAGKPEKRRALRREQNNGLYDGYSSRYKPSPFSESSRRKRARERRRQMIIGWPLAVLCVIALLLVVTTLIAFLPQFYINKITVNGLRMIPREEVESFITKREGDHFIGGIGGSTVQLLTLRYGEIEKHILENLHLARSVKAQFRFPSEIRVTLVEKTEVLAIRVPGGFALLDRGLNVIRKTGDKDFDLPVLEGIRIQSDPEIDREIDVPDKAQLFAAANITAALIEHDSARAESEDSALMRHVQQIKQISDHTYLLFIPLSQGGEIRVKLEDNRSLQDKLRVLSYLLGAGGLLDRGAGELDLTGRSALFRPDTA
ncbi:MAG TPA: hypothetical protein PKH23_06195 [Bacillota bacterium]|nr:hypothetical protein [Bacillota bacterium]